jgi:FtsP/CotA-like multicopper oxidase with cupredoxin domain
MSSTLVLVCDHFIASPQRTSVSHTLTGQRYEIIVEANANLDNGSNFWINAHYCDMPELMGKPHMGIVRYNASDKSDPVTGPPAHLDFGCMDPTADELVPIVPKQVGRRVNDLEPADYLKIGLQGWPNASDPNSLIRKWALGSGPMYSDWREPSVKRLTLNAGNSSQFPPESEPMHLDYETGEWVYFVIENNHELPEADPPRVIPRSVHPIHLHGHDFYVLAQGPGKFNESIVPNLDNPPRRDVANCPIYGHLWIGFPVDNPGAWLLHCHIAWHSSAGFSIQFLEQTSKILPLMDQTGALPELEARCAEWKDYYENEHPDKGKQVDMRRV